MVLFKGCSVQVNSISNKIRFIQNNLFFKAIYFFPRYAFELFFFRIEADFEEKVGDEEKKKEFLNSLRTQLATIHNCESKSCIDKLRVEKGSILVYFKLVGTESEEAKLENAYKEFMSLLKTGNFNLVSQIDFNMYLFRLKI